MSPSEPELDLSQCDREPIHLLGGIQPHGVLLAFRGPERTLAVVSANTQELLGRPPEALLGLPLAQVLPPDMLLQLDAASAQGFARVELQGRAFRALLHASDGLTVLELEPAESEPHAEEHALEWVGRLVSPLPGARGTQALLQAAAEAVRALTGFDRVMVYRFDADWHGEVLAESRREGVDGFLGLHFPASDIPAQARALYTRNPLRLIADARAAPVPLVPFMLPELRRPLDLSGAALRSVSPVHLEYLRNMGVVASFSLSLLQEGALWGLIACHHHAPLHVSHERRRACEVLTRLLTLQLAAEERAAEATEHTRRSALLGRLATQLEQRSSLAEALPRHAVLVLELTGATGAALLLGEQPLLVGTTPPAAEVEALATWLAAQPFETVFQTERLGALFPPLAPRADVAAGLLAVRLEPAAPRFALWFRPELPRTVTWGGDPQKPVSAEPAGARLHPRASFHAWEETVRGASRPWARADLEAAEDFRGALVGVVLRQAEELTRLTRALARSNAELDAFAYTVAHDLKEPLRGIQVYADILQEEHGGALGEEGQRELEFLKWLAQRSGAQLEALFEYSRLGRLELSWGLEDMQRLVEEVLGMLTARLAEGRVEVRIPRRLPQVHCDGVRIRQVWANLLSNAAKYQQGEERWIEVGFHGPGEPRPEAASRYEAPYVFHVRDPGIGIPEQFHEAIFELFRRLHPERAYGGGTGAGLAIARRLVRLHGGELWVDSAPGKGSTFYFTLGRRAG
ncbi:MAG: GAF domain-containing protein [Myxococcaceae bacterium]|nr:GAF domain-containing protein [Myxococcaceae bacterium]